MIPFKNNYLYEKNSNSSKVINNTIVRGHYEYSCNNCTPR